MLNSLGIDPEIQQVYLAMVDEPEAGVPELATSLGRDEGWVRTAMNRLAELSLVAGSDGAPMIAIDPEIALAALLARQQAELAQRQRDVEESRLGIAQLLASHGGRKIGSDPEVERLLGSGVVRARIAALAAEGQEETLSFSPTGRLSTTAIEAARPATQDAARRGVRLRSIYLDSVRNDDVTMAYLRWQMELGAEIRTLPSLPVRLLVIDQTRALIPISNAHCGAGALVLSGEVIVKALAALFAGHWKEAKPLGDRRPRKEGVLSLQEKHILRLWAHGHTDASAARRMEVSIRTVRRLSDNLSERLGTHSRFQLGALAIANGYIDPDDLA
ncbi:regulatory LuxR family protein [Stackebrandtia albiflava]|uniref:Regulatory LuxR family protein n=1 Tax=Stackebrandtia albiflava TaxID=406432 RepID=A0A562VBY1_9ACTN|nr:LuxR C-terminal-related transcriptional regulator [Stackebrandtia albiflava]TWJ15368.1 regulatory LuxR family protein [Stackebrandtia albiflava]